jgi:hypothetical protein
MPSTISPSARTSTRSPRRRGDVRDEHSRLSPPRRGAQRRRRQARLGGYVDEAGRAREVLALPASARTTLVVDRDRATRGDQRLVAHLAADEPRENAALVCGSYLEQVQSRGIRCRRVTEDDLRATPFADLDAADEQIDAPSVPVDRHGNAYRLRPARGELSVPELRWSRTPPGGCGQPQTVSLREVVAAVESYEPARTLTIRASAGTPGGAVSVAVLRAELARVQLSPIVLNRRLREEVLACIERDGLSMSEIAIRCGRVKRSAGAAQTGETSWLARRLGLLPEGGKTEPTPWIHSDVLALIARRGLALSPREVEL